MPIPGEPDYHAALTHLENLRARWQTALERLRLHDEQKPSRLLPLRARQHAQRSDQLRYEASRIEHDVKAACAELGIAGADDQSVGDAWKLHLSRVRPAETATEQPHMHDLFSEHDLRGGAPSPGEHLPPPNPPATPTPASTTHPPVINHRPLGDLMGDLRRDYPATPRAPSRSHITMPAELGTPDLQQWISTRLDMNYRQMPIIQQLRSLSQLTPRKTHWEPAPVGLTMNRAELSSLLWWRHRFLQGEEVEYDPNAALTVALGLCLGIGQQDTEESMNASFMQIGRLWKLHNTTQHTDITLAAWATHFVALYQPNTEASKAWRAQHLRLHASGAALELWLRHVDRQITRGAWRYCTPPSAPVRAKMDSGHQLLMDHMEQRALELAARWLRDNGQLNPLLQGPVRSEDRPIFGGTGYINTTHYRQRMHARLSNVPDTLKDAARMAQYDLRRTLKLGGSRPSIRNPELLEALRALNEQQLKDAGVMTERPSRKKRKDTETPAPEVPAEISVDLSRVQALEADSERVRLKLLDSQDLAHLGVEADFTWSLSSEETQDCPPAAADISAQPDPATEAQNTPPVDRTPDSRLAAPEPRPAATPSEPAPGLSAAARTLLRAALDAPQLSPGRSWEGQALSDVMDEINAAALDDLGDVLLFGDEHELSLEPSYREYALRLEDQQKPAR